MNRNFLSAVSGTLLGGAVLLAGCHGKSGGYSADDESGGDKTQTLVTVQVGQLKQATLHAYVSGYGSVQPSPATATTGAATARVAPPQSGVVLRVHVVEGQHVNPGDRLVDLDDRAADVAVKYAAETAARQQTLYAEHNTSLKALQDAEAALGTAKAQLALVHITAPLAGTVTRLNVRPGEAVDGTTVLAEITDLSRLAVSADIPAAEANNVEPSDPLDILGEKHVTAKVDYVSPAVDPTNGTLTVRAALPADAGLRSGTLVRLRITTGTHTNVLAAPAASVVTNEEGADVVAIVNQDQATQVPVKVGYRDDGLVEVSGNGLKPGDTVVTVGAYGLPAKTQVQIAKP